MIKENTIKFRNIILIALLIIWFLMFFVGVGIASYKDVVYFKKEENLSFYELYIKQEYNLQIYDISQSEFEGLLDSNKEVEIQSRVYDIKAIYLSLYLIFALVLLACTIFQQMFRKKLPPAIYLLGLLPFIVSCCICICADKSYIVHLEANRGVAYGGFGYFTYLPVLGDWLSAIVALAAFGFSWLCNHWIKQGVPVPQPKERVPKERKKEKPKSDKQRIDELEKRLQELEGSKQD